MAHDWMAILLYSEPDFHASPIPGTSFIYPTSGPPSWERPFGFGG
jgi:hypothetical protein